MTRLIDPHLANLSEMMKQMCDLSIKCTTLAIDSYLGGQNASKEVKQISNQMMDLYDKIGDLTFEMILRYQPVASDFRLIRSSLEISYGFTRLGRYSYDITQVRDTFGDLSECKNIVIGRFGYSITKWNLDENNCCNSCGYPIPVIGKLGKSARENRFLYVV